jgi:hypothetical protein
MNLSSKAERAGMEAGEMLEGKHDSGIRAEHAPSLCAAGIINPATDATRAFRDVGAASLGE